MLAGGGLPKVIAQRLRVKIPFGLDHEIPQASAAGGNRDEAQRVATGNLFKFGRAYRKGARKRGPRAHVSVGSATPIGVQTSAEP